jgi:nucleoside-diphosphate-sugar epimerase
MTRTRVPPVLVTGATGRVGRAVVDLLINAGMPVRALTHRSEAAPTLPANVEVVTGDLAVPESLDAGLRGVSAVFLVWTAPPTTAPAVVELLATYARRVVFLSSPHQTPRPFFQQPNPMAVLHADIERLIAASPDEFRSETEGSRPRPVVDMLLAAWGATIGRPAFITSTVSDLLGSAPRSFRQWVADHPTAFIEDPTPSS